MTCIIDMAVRNHAHNEGILDDYQDAINARILELTDKGGEFYPFNPRNMQEAIGNWGENRDLVMSFCLERGVECSGLIALWIEGYWLLEAEKRAINELTKPQNKSSAPEFISDAA